MTELNADEMFKPIIFARQEVVNNTNQYVIVIPFISRIKLPIRIKEIDWIAEIINIIRILEFR
jgi:hypothetical protein